MEKWKNLSGDRGGGVVEKLVDWIGKVGGKVVMSTCWIKYLIIVHIFAVDFRKDLRVVLHGISTIWVILLTGLTINALLDLFDLVAKFEIKL